MIVTEYYKTRKDGVKLYFIIDAAINERGQVIRDEKNNIVPSGFKIKKTGTNDFYDYVYDVLGANNKYEQTNIPIEPPKESEELIKVVDNDV
jgi:hypothetical protein